MTEFNWGHFGLFAVLILGSVLTVVMGFIWFERRALARMQIRLGPNRAGPFGLLQPVADVLKVLIKEDIVPTQADKIVHWLAPIVALVPALMIFAVVPFQDGGLLADLNIGLLYVLAVSSVSTLGIFMAGWASNNKYTIIAAMRDVAAVVSYEIPLALSLVGVILVAGTMSMNEIVQSQNTIPLIFWQPLGFFIFFISGLAEINRTPFDLLEADSEIIAGFHTEYSGMKFALFYLMEYAETLALSALVATFFLGGWQGFLLPGWLWLLLKIVIVFFVIMWVRATLPRVRIDQMMAMAWKFLFPLALLNLVITGIEVVAWPEALPWTLIPVNIVIAGALILLLSRNHKTGWGRVEV
ncbi:MAG: NADH-quinone oxidoreductase subunit NuoH [Dehalococcoidales bacterium]|nr:NADH-quinone oxidoreductase subunit NuoH [Dehalococcoidales bacterium]